MNPNDCLVRFESLEWKSPADRVRQKIGTLGAQRVRLLEMQHGLEHPEWCTRGHAGYVLEGDLTLEFDGGSVKLTAGDALIIPPGTTYRHRPVPTSQRVVLVLVEDAEPVT